jgi:hypothetical protein
MKRVNRACSRAHGIRSSRLKTILFLLISLGTVAAPLVQAQAERWDQNNCLLVADQRGYFAPTGLCRAAMQGSQDPNAFNLQDNYSRGLFLNFRSDAAGWLYVHDYRANRTYAMANQNSIMGAIHNMGRDPNSYVQTPGQPWMRIGDLAAKLDGLRAQLAPLAAQQAQRQPYVPRCLENIDPRLVREPPPAERECQTPAEQALWDRVINGAATDAFNRTYGNIREETARTERARSQCQSEMSRGTYDRQGLGRNGAYDVYGNATSPPPACSRY